jgi:hypothetical protein
MTSKNRSQPSRRNTSIPERDPDEANATGCTVWNAGSRLAAAS